MIYFLFSLLLQTVPLLAGDDDFNSVLPEPKVPLLDEPIPHLPGDNDFDINSFLRELEEPLPEEVLPPATNNTDSPTDAIEPLPQNPAPALPSVRSVLLDHPRLETEDEPPTKKSATNTEEGINLEQFIEHIIALMRKSNPLLIPIGSPVKIMTANPDFKYERELLYLLFVMNYVFRANRQLQPLLNLNLSFLHNNHITIPTDFYTHGSSKTTTITEEHIVALQNTLHPSSKSEKTVTPIIKISSIIRLFIYELAENTNQYFGVCNHENFQKILSSPLQAPEYRLKTLKKARFYIKKHPTLTKWPSRSSSGCNPGMIPFRKNNDDQDPNGGNSHQGFSSISNFPFLSPSAFLPIPTQSTATSQGQQRTATQHTVLQYLNNIVFTLLSVKLQQRNQLQNDLGCQPMVSAF